LFFDQKSFFVGKLIFNLIIGLGFTFLIAYNLIPTLKFLEDITMDFVMDVHRRNIPPRGENIPPFVLLDIDDETYKNWGQPLYTPRNKLKNIINAAVQAKARLIVVLIDLSQSIKQQPLHPDDQALYNYLKNYVHDCKLKKNIACPPIILARAFVYQQSTTNSIAKPRIGFLEEFVRDATPHVQWASTQVYLSFDDVVRRNSLWSPTCIGKQPGVIASAELLAASIIQGETNIYNALAPFQPKDCDNAYMPPNLAENINVGGLSIKPINRQRILYRIPWSNDEAPPKLPHIVPNNTGVPILTILSAQSFAESPPVDLDVLTDHVVVIYGNERGYTFLTPLGEMPGALIFINSLYSLLQDKNILPLSPWIWLILMSLVMVLMTFLTMLSSFYRAITLILMTIIFLGFASYSIILFSRGVWVNFLLPIIVVGMMLTYEMIYEKLLKTFPFLKEIINA
jgi:hypothetical protein